MMARAGWIIHDRHSGSEGTIESVNLEIDVLAHLVGVNQLADGLKLALIALPCTAVRSRQSCLGHLTP